MLETDNRGIHKYLTISSADRVNGTPANFQLQLPYGIHFNYAN